MIGTFFVIFNLVLVVTGIVFIFKVWSTIFKTDKETGYKTGSESIYNILLGVVKACEKIHELTAKKLDKMDEEIEAREDFRKA